MDKSVQGTAEESFYSSIQQLKTKQKEYEVLQLYEAAEGIEKQIQKLKENYKTEALLKLKQSQKKELQSLDLIYQREVKELEDSWNDRISNCKEKFNTQKEKLTQRHLKLFEKEKKELEKNTSFIFKPSSQLLNLISCREKAVGSKKYKEAKIMNIEIEEALELEKKDFTQQRVQKINKQLLLLKQKMDKESTVLEKRQESELASLVKLRDFERENVGKKVENICRELENMQNIKINIVKKMNNSGLGRSPKRPVSSYRSEFTTPQRSSSTKKSSPRPSYKYL